jgi:hypothetical protein
MWSAFIPEDFREKRAASRYDAVRSLVYLGWWEDDEFRTCAGSLQNLSQSGALINAGQAPPETAPVYLCLAGAEPGEWVETTCSVTTRPRDVFYRLRLRFSEACPYDFFRSAVLDLAATV